jgi:trans-2,3-dihydro-3-hydroxyanthranilate isomerase
MAALNWMCHNCLRKKDVLNTKEDLALILNLAPEEIGFENHQPCCYSCGTPFLLVPVQDAKVLARCKPVFPQWDKTLKKECATALFVYTRQTLHTSSSFQGRMFAPSLGVMEDPATGSAVSALAGAIFDYDTPPEGLHHYIIEQGAGLGRESFLHLSMKVRQRKIEQLRLKGRGVLIAEGQLFA